MQYIYGLMEHLLPFSWVQFDFMKNAFLCILLMTPLFGMLGIMIINHKMAYFSDALGHSALSGMAVGVLLGISDGNISMILFGVFFALVLNKIKRRETAGKDTLISVLSSLCIAVGLAVLSRGGDFSSYSSLLIGDILSVQGKELGYLAVILLITILFWCLCFNQVNAISLNASLSKSRGINVPFMENVFAVLVAVVVMLSIKWVGVLLINALLILPSAASRNIAANMREYHWFSILFSIFSGILGLILSFYIDISSASAIVIVAAAIFLFTYAAKSIK